MLVNLSNHPSDRWPPEQRDAALAQFGTVTDLPFPEVDPQARTIEIARLARTITSECLRRLTDSASVNAVHVAGEFTLTYQIVRELERVGIRAVVATTRRIVAEQPSGERTYRFEFSMFRDYYRQ
ncbi:MAG: hypothetical protein H6508_08175 [Calditrichaeota bacterium]|nr:hypothetical protein [Calditrichota bacterium]